MLGPAFEVAQGQAMFEMVTLGAVPLGLPLPRNFRFRRRQRRDSKTRSRCPGRPARRQRRMATGPT